MVAAEAPQHVCCPHHAKLPCGGSQLHRSWRIDHLLRGLNPPRQRRQRHICLVSIFENKTTNHTSHYPNPLLNLRPTKLRLWPSVWTQAHRCGPAGYVQANPGEVNRAGGSPNAVHQAEPQAAVAAGALRRQGKMHRLQCAISFAHTNCRRAPVCMAMAASRASAQRRHGIDCSADTSCA